MPFLPPNQRRQSTEGLMFCSTNSFSLAFNALTRLAERQEEHPACEN